MKACTQSITPGRRMDDDPLLPAPGAKITYSTYGYTLLGLAIERASGQSYIDLYARTRVQARGARCRSNRTAIAILANIEEARLVPLTDEIAAIVNHVPVSTQPITKTN